MLKCGNKTENYMNLKKLIKEIVDTMEDSKIDFKKSPRNFSAGRRARLATLKLSKLFKQFRKISMETKKNEDKNNLL